MSDSAPIALVVDDDEGIRTVYIQELVFRGYAVLEARDGKEALDILMRGNQVNLILTDLNMPRLDGGSLIVRLVECGFTFDAVILATAADPSEPVIEHVRTAISETFPFFVHSKSNFTGLGNILSEVEEKYGW